MDNTITALTNLYAALGGDTANVADIIIIPDMINAIAEQVITNKTAETNVKTDTEGE